MNGVLRIFLLLEGFLLSPPGFSVGSSYPGGKALDSCSRSTRLFCHRSEANDLALRLARQYTGHWDVVVLDQ